MLNRTRFAVFAGTLVVGCVWAGVGCTIKEVDPSDPVPTSSNSTSSNNPTVTGSGGNGGAGGNGTGGTSTSNGGAGGGTGGSGGTCVGVDGTGLGADACDGMQITPESAGGPASSICGDNDDEDPPGYGTCLAGFDVYTKGSFENLQACLAEITVEPASACDPQLVLDCVTEVYEEACPRPEIDTLCADFEAGCANVGQTFDIAKCSIDLAPLSTLGLEDYEACVNGAPPEETCQQAHDFCAG